MANITFRPFNDNFDIEDVRTALAFLWESSQVDEIGTDTLITIRYIGTTYEDLADIYIEFYGDFSSDNFEDWQIDRVEMGQGTEVVLTLDELSINGPEVGAQDGDNLLSFLMSGNDTITTETNFADAVVEGYDGDDRFAMASSGLHVAGGRGQDTAVFDFGVRDATIQAETVRPEGETQEFHILRVTNSDDTEYTLYEIEATEFNGERYEITGGSADSDLLTGSPNTRDLIAGAGGNDTILGGNGADLLIGEGGDDTILGGNGRDFIQAGTDNDMVRGGNGADRILGNEGNDVLRGGFGRDTLNGGEGNDRIYGGKGFDLLNGSRGNDRLFGEARNDTLRGQLGDDSLFGGSGNDMLFGGQGNDLLRGGAGNDFFNGGAGDDVFVFTSGNGDDRIVNFAAGEDTIRIQDGADSLEDLSFETLGDDVLVSFSDVTILVQDVELNALQDADNFLF
ncbi:hypothetical protein GG681_03145 [Epibacterium sp. SM1969]|uniref:Bifunctional hemolysin/adenylate cyclase n=1 Tax=Tritonibacter aquimaris TaxID=2663379 RepID=A0A844ATB9_9RHOB|nr:calcium-binding protein [Tritonibacter aquimaris]MQY41624.1 hypothetical protein [Tritonibacter aquimaris]